MMMRLILLLIGVSMGAAAADARIFDTEQQYLKTFGTNLNKGTAAPPPFKFALYKKKNLRIVVLFDNQISQGELYAKPSSRLTEADVTGVLAANQGTSSWKKERVENTNNPKSPE